MEKMPLKILENDHEMVKDLFLRFNQISDNEEKNRVAKKTFKNLEIHGKVEEELVYPIIRNFSEKGKEMIEHGIEEHRKIMELIKQTKGLGIASVDFSPKFQELAQAVIHHVTEEENTVFPFAEKNLGNKLSVGLGAKMLKMKAGEKIARPKLE